jgi:hypothetical protein
MHCRFSKTEFSQGGACNVQTKDVCIAPWVATTCTSVHSLPYGLHVLLSIWTTYGLHVLLSTWTTYGLHVLLSTWTTYGLHVLLSTWTTYGLHVLLSTWTTYGLRRYTCTSVHMDYIWTTCTSVHSLPCMPAFPSRELPVFPLEGTPCLGGSPEKSKCIATIRTDLHFEKDPLSTLPSCR